MLVSHIMIIRLEQPKDGRDVADPWYTGDFDATWDDIASGCEGLLEQLSTD